MIRYYGIDESAAHYERNVAAYHGPEVPSWEEIKTRAIVHATAVASGNPGLAVTVTVTAVDEHWKRHTVFEITVTENFPTLVTLS